MAVGKAGAEPEVKGLDVACVDIDEVRVDLAEISTLWIRGKVPHTKSVKVPDPSLSPFKANSWHMGRPETLFSSALVDREGV